MKKGIIIAFIAILGITQTQAQVTFKPGLRGGLNLSHFTKGNIYDNNSNSGNGINSSNNAFKSKADFYLGFYGALKLTKYYTLQPEIDYSRQGSSYEAVSIPKTILNVSYLSIGIVNKFTFTDKFNVHLGPTIDFVVDKDFNNESDVDLAFLLGAGYNFTSNFGLEARIKKGIIPVFYNRINNNGSDHTNVVFSIGATYTFDLK
jgi:Outer membrane protein beta-barrel domain